MSTNTPTTEDSTDPATELAIAIDRLDSVETDRLTDDQKQAILDATDQLDDVATSLFARGGR